MAQEVADFVGLGGEGEEEEEVAYEELKRRLSSREYSERVERFKRRVGWPERRRRQLDQFGVKIIVRKGEKDKPRAEEEKN